MTIEGCSIYEGTGNTSLQVAWQLPVKTYGMLKNCSFNISVLEDILEDILEDNITAPFVFGVTTEVGNARVYNVIYVSMIYVVRISERVYTLLYARCTSVNIVYDVHDCLSLANTAPGGQKQVVHSAISNE